MRVHPIIAGLKKLLKDVVFQHQLIIMSIALLAQRFNTAPINLQAIIHPILESFHCTLKHFDSYKSLPKTIPRKILQLSRCHCTEQHHYTITRTTFLNGPNLRGTQIFDFKLRRLLTHIVIGYLRVVQDIWAPEIAPGVDAEHFLATRLAPHTHIITNHVVSFYY
jgi:hypothetical protein